MIFWDKKISNFTLYFSSISRLISIVFYEMVFFCYEIKEKLKKK